jgi:hypothetical protein
MLSVKYGADVPLSLAEVAEHHARAAGVSLDALEVIGASLDFVEAFIVASEDGQCAEFVARLGLDRAATARARTVAERLFGGDRKAAT